MIIIYRGWINQLKNAVTRVTLLLTHSSVGVKVLKAARKHDMIGREYVWVASTALSDATVRIIIIAFQTTSTIIIMDVTLSIDTTKSLTKLYYCIDI